MPRPFFSFAVFRVLRVTPLLPVRSIVRTDRHKKNCAGRAASAVI